MGTSQAMRAGRRPAGGDPGQADPRGRGRRAEAAAERQRRQTAKVAEDARVLRESQAYMNAQERIKDNGGALNMGLSRALSYGDDPKVKGFVPSTSAGSASAGRRPASRSARSGPAQGGDLPEHAGPDRGRRRRAEHGAEPQPASWPTTRRSSAWPTGWPPAARRPRSASASWTVPAPTWTATPSGASARGSRRAPGGQRARAEAPDPQRRRALRQRARPDRRQRRRAEHGPVADAAGVRRRQQGAATGRADAR